MIYINNIIKIYMIANYYIIKKIEIFIRLKHLYILINNTLSICKKTENDEYLIKYIEF